MYLLRKAAALIVLSYVPSTCSMSVRGFDTTQVCNASCMQCMRVEAGNKFFIGRVYAADGGFDEIGLQNMGRAVEAGMGKFSSLSNVSRTYSLEQYILNICFSRVRTH